MKKYIKPETAAENIVLDTMIALSANGNISADSGYESESKERDYDEKSGWTDGLW